MSTTMTFAPTITLADGNRIPQLGLGVWQAEADGPTEEAVTEAINAGYRLIDTAAMYQNEPDVGRGIVASGVAREELFVTTKLWNSDQGFGNVRTALLKSLSNLGLEYVDLYLIHWPSPAKDLYVDTWKEFIALRDEGLIKSIGVSNFQPEHLQRLMEETGELPVVNQVELHPYFQQQEVRAFCADHNIQVESWSPIGGSTGQLLSEPVLAQIGAIYEKTPAQIVLRWHIQHRLVVIPKSIHAERIYENFDIFDFELTDQDMALIDDLQNGERQGPNPDTFNG